jgi:hypothetical protein
MGFVHRKRNHLPAWETRKRVKGLELYIHPEGDNNNTGLKNTPDHALYDFAGIRNKIDEYDLCSGDIAIYIARGIYIDRDFTLYLSTIVGGRLVYIKGSGDGGTIIKRSTATAYKDIGIINLCDRGVKVHISDIKIQHIGAKCLMIDHAHVYSSGNITVEAVEETSEAYAVHVTNIGRLECINDSKINIKGNYTHIFWAHNKSILRLLDVTYTGSTECATNIFCTEISHGDLTRTSFSGSVRGRRYTVSSSSLILTGKTATFIPGTIEGNTSSGGVYA